MNGGHALRRRLQPPMALQRAGGQEDRVVDQPLQCQPAYGGGEVGGIDRSIHGPLNARKAGRGVRLADLPPEGNEQKQLI